MDILKKEKPFSMDVMIRLHPIKLDYFHTLQQSSQIILSFHLAIFQWINQNSQLLG